MIDFFRRHITSLQNLPERKRRIIFFVIMGCVGATMLLFIAQTTISNTKKAQRTIEKVDFSEITRQLNDSLEEFNR
jgi:hypothetical protein